MIESMDDAADKAAIELDKLPTEHVNTVATWWKEWYLKAGHKRLGRALVAKIRQKE